MRASRSTPGVNNGDSGGPVYDRSNGKIRGQGIVNFMSTGRATLCYLFPNTALVSSGSLLCGS